MTAPDKQSSQQHTQPGIEEVMDPAPVYDDPDYKAAKKLLGKVALITGGDSGIGRAVAIAYAKEGALLALAYLDEDRDANETKQCAERYGAEVILLKGDLGNTDFAKSCVTKTIEHFGQLDILVNNAGEQHPQETPEDISQAQLIKTFETNFFSIVSLTLESLKYMSTGATIINTSSVTAFHGNPKLIDYSSTKGAITAFTRSLSNSIVPRGIRVNSVAPGPVWTPLIVSTFNEEEIASFGKNTPMERPGQPCEMAPAYVYLACNDSSYMSGQTLHINGGKFVAS
jgi:NAD(P)-dependent dehydrogenase (short-subunit alcohol dehydrogenase family)